jgi:hypothetical protein
MLSPEPLWSVFSIRMKDSHGSAAKINQRNLRHSGCDWAGLVFVPVACLVNPVTRAVGFALAQYALSALNAELPDGPSDGDLALFGSFVWIAIVLICVVPVIVVAWIGPEGGGCSGMQAR